MKVKAEELTEKLQSHHLELGGEYLEFLETTEIEPEVERQEAFRTEQLTKLAALNATLLSKTPTGVVAAPVQQVHGHVGGDRDTIGQSYSSDTDGSKVRSKMKMAPMAIPKFSGKTVDYPEWKKLFKDCIEAQYEESAAVMTMKTLRS